VSVELVNALAIDHAGGKSVPTDEPVPVIAQALAVDPASVAQLGESDAAGFVALASRLRDVFDALGSSDVDGAASRLNTMLAEHPAHPHLAKERGRWRMHHHPVDAALVPMWTSICAEGLARMIGAGDNDRLGTCRATDCERVFLDLSKNASRRFCSTTCQNRTKAATFRRRRATGDP
jgi:predicted RNA-binding Zn ribbon-like protein